MEKLPSYFAFMLRLQRESRRWRASLEDPRTSELRGFPDLQSLLEYLFRLTGEVENSEKKEKDDYESEPETP